MDSLGFLSNSQIRMLLFPKSVTILVYNDFYEKIEIFGDNLIEIKKEKAAQLPRRLFVVSSGRFRETTP